MDNIGIYCIYFEEVPDRLYIGSSTNLKVRFQDHLSALRRGSHINPKLQDAFNKYGTPRIEILTLCKTCDLIKLEIFYINEFNSYKHGFNSTTGGEGSGFGEGNSASKYSLQDYMEVLWLLVYTNYTTYEIASLTLVSRYVVKHISSLSTHGYLKEVFPVEYSILETKKYTKDNSAKSKGIAYPAIKDSLGNEYFVENIHRFAEEHSLQYQNLHKVLTGKRPIHKGWTLA